MCIGYKFNRENETENGRLSLLFHPQCNFILTWSMNLSHGNINPEQCYWVVRLSVLPLQCWLFCSDQMFSCGWRNSAWLTWPVSGQLGGVGLTGINIDLTLFAIWPACQSQLFIFFTTPWNIKLFIFMIFKCVQLLLVLLFGSIFFKAWLY